MSNSVIPATCCAAKATTCTGAAAGDLLEVDLREIKDKCKKWNWKGRYAINYFVSHSSSDPHSSNPNRPPILLVHGFGASIPHWRRTLAQIYTVYAIDLIGFGASEKPVGFSYTMEKWAELILDFLDEIVQEPTVLIGNSVGSLACVIAAASASGAEAESNNKALVRGLQRGIASAIFERVKQRDNIRNILLSVYGNKESVDEELVEIIMEPTCDPGALDAFVSIVTGPPGPSPVQLMPTIISSSLPLLVLWGDEDPFTPLDGPIGKYFASLPSQLPYVTLFVLQGVGHCPHDDRPDLVHQKLLPWLDHFSTVTHT
ncbi:alpha/beta-Hydrolases superfamily protein [Prunus dulcis]|uniref:Alpha/beta-Hydrolases superfamily protein n=1 Tax=Prunus dulcis TaxID=3755 RepID=A0A4Y1QSA3_PRUDU|nr:alpha/beta-Hydrolases superfamily protein [Prunus dulcis]